MHCHKSVTDQIIILSLVCRKLGVKNLQFHVTTVCSLLQSNLFTPGNYNFFIYVGFISSEIIIVKFA